MIKEIQSSLKPFSIPINEGKLIRPQLVYFFGKHFGIKEKNILDMAFIVEGIHNASLFIDDIIDDNPIRRGKPSLFQLKGDKKAISFSLLLISRIIKKINKNYPPLLNLALKIFEKMSKSEISYINKKNYIKLCYQKTATLFIFSCIAPYLSLGWNKVKISDLKKIYNFSKYLGILFQIRDDIIDEDLDIELSFLEKKYHEVYGKLKKSLINLPGFDQNSIEFLIDRLKDWISL